jgi:hypothetical protein
MKMPRAESAAATIEVPDRGAPTTIIVAVLPIGALARKATPELCSSFSIKVSNKSASAATLRTDGLPFQPADGRLTIVF